MFNKARTLIHVAGRSIVAVGITTSIWTGGANADSNTTRKKIVIIGGGTAGVGVAAMIANEGVSSDITVIEPSDVHYYQPLWTLVGGGIKENTDSAKPMGEVIPKSAKWVKQSTTTINPESNSIQLADGSTVSYDYLIVAAGLQTDWGKIPGLETGLNDEFSGVVSIYDFKHSANTWKTLQKFKGGRAIFTIPNTPLKCPGAPQKIMWLFEERCRDLGFRDQTKVEFWVPGTAMFGIKKYADVLALEAKNRHVIQNFKTELISINVDEKLATFKHLADGSETIEKYDFLHVAPPMSSPDFLKKSAVSNASGFVDVDRHTLQSMKYKNVFAIGDCAGTPNSKSAAAITSQAPVLVHNLKQAIDGKELNGKYSGYGSCPLIIGKGKAILAEFGYDGKILETFDTDLGRFPYSLIGQEGYLQQKFFYFLKDTLFPFVYWNLWTKGKWYGSYGIFKPDVTKTKIE